MKPKKKIKKGEEGKKLFEDSWDWMAWYVIDWCEWEVFVMREYIWWLMALRFLVSFINLSSQSESFKNWFFERIFVYFYFGFK